MPNTTEEIAKRFVGLVLKYPKWESVNALPGGEFQILFDVVAAAGFNPQKVLSGRVVQNPIKDAQYPINPLFPFHVVVSGDNGDVVHCFATGWLHCAFLNVTHASNGKNIEQLIQVMSAEILRSIPLEPIQLTHNGDLLCEKSPTPYGVNYFVDHTRDEKKLNKSVGIHMHCGAIMKRRRVAVTHDAMLCDGCFLRVLFPKDVMTYGDLRRVFAHILQGEVSV